jgi:hypothetical protein
LEDDVKAYVKCDVSRGHHPRHHGRSERQEELLTRNEVHDGEHGHDTVLDVNVNFPALLRSSRQ